MQALFLAHFAATWALVGLIWTVHLAVYPRFAPRADFPADHARYTRGITVVVAPLMLAELGTAVALLLLGWRNPLFLLSLIPLAGNWLSTALLQVPVHRQLALGYDRSAHRRLLVTNRLRVGCWSLRAVLLTLACPPAGPFAEG